VRALDPHQEPPLERGEGAGGDVTQDLFQQYSSADPGRRLQAPEHVVQHCDRAVVGAGGSGHLERGGLEADPRR